MGAPAREETEAVSGTADKQPAHVVTSVGRTTAYGGRWIVLAIVAVIVLIALVAVALVHRRTDVVKGPVCTDKLLTSTSDRAALAKRVRSMPGYDKDPNCLYMLAAQDIMANDTNQASKDIATLRSIAGKNPVFSKTFGKNATIGTLDQLLRVQKALQNDTLNGAVKSDI